MSVREVLGLSSMELTKWKAYFRVRASESARASNRADMRARNAKAAGGRRRR